MKTLVVTGTLVAPWYKNLVYGRFDRYANRPQDDFAIESLHQLGLSHPMHTCRQIAERHFEGAKEPIALFGHSQGGLIALWLAQHYPELAVAVFQLGAPNHGFWGASRFSPLFASVRAMAPKSRFIAGLKVGQDVPVFSFWSVGDLAVMPLNTARVRGPKAHNYFVAPARFKPFLLPILPRNVEWLNSRVEEHTSLIYSPVVEAKIIEKMAEIRAA